MFLYLSFSYSDISANSSFVKNSSISSGRLINATESKLSMAPGAELPWKLQQTRKPTESGKARRRVCQHDLDLWTLHYIGVFISLSLIQYLYKEWSLYVKTPLSYCVTTKYKQNIEVCKTLMPPFPNRWIVGLTFDLAIWPTDLNINRDHLLIKGYLPTKSEASGAKHSWVISCIRYGQSTWPLTLTFDLLTWISIGIIYLSRNIYLPSLKLLGQSVLELSVAQG